MEVNEQSPRTYNTPWSKPQAISLANYEMIPLTGLGDFRGVFQRCVETTLQ